MLFLDTNAVIYYLHDIKPYSEIVEEIISEEEELYTSIKVLDEAFFTLIRSLAWRDFGIRRIEKLRNT